MQDTENSAKAALLPQRWTDSLVKAGMRNLEYTVYTTHIAAACYSEQVMSCMRTQEQWWGRHTQRIHTHTHSKDAQEARVVGTQGKEGKAEQSPNKRGTYECYIHYLNLMISSCHAYCSKTVLNDIYHQRLIHFLSYLLIALIKRFI